MFIKSDIRKVTIALEKFLGQKVFVSLGRAGIVHLSRLQTGDALTDAGIAEKEARTRDILAGSRFALMALQIEIGEAFASENPFDADRDTAVVDRAKKITERLQRLRVRIQEKAAALTVQLEYAEALNKMGVDPGAIKKTRLVRMVFGEVADPFPALPQAGPFALTQTGRYVFGAALPEAFSQMLQRLNTLNFVDKTAGISGASIDSLKGRAAALQRRLDALDQYTDRFRKEKGPELLELYHSYKGYEEILRAMRQSAFSAKAMFITGWMDARDKPRLLAILRELCGERFIVSDEKDPDAPVRLMNMRLFKPFELIVKTMGMPAGSEIDPTPLTAVTFVLVFGLMFGDLGQGLVLAAAGLVLKLIADKKANENLSQAGAILMICGLWAAFCGVLYGSLFSSEHLIPALWIRPAENIMRLFAVTILLGALVIVVGLSVNIVNALMNSDYPEAFLEKKGLAVLILYCAVVLMAFRYLSGRQLPALWEIGALIILPLLVFSLRGILAPILFGTKAPPDIAGYVTETVMDIVEISLSLFANTVSFIRVGAFALSHAGLSIVTYTLAGMADPSLTSAGAIAILVFGNIFIIGFEGLICGIQSMRLEYYEFFSKFYRGDGVAFSPFVLKTKMPEV